MSAKRIPKRSPDQTRLSFSLSKDLREKLEALAAKERRTLSNLISVLIEQKFGDMSVAEQPQGNIINPAQNNAFGAGEVRPQKYKIRKQA